MSAVLRGRNLPLEQSLSVLAEAMKKQFPRHMVGMPVVGGPAHNAIVTAFIGNEARLYTIDLALKPDRKSYNFRYTRHMTPNQRAPRLAIAGTGALYLMHEKAWTRSLLRVVRAHDRSQVSSSAVADHLARLNNEVHLGVSDKSVGPRSIVAWRHRKEGIHKGGGGHQFYTSTTRDPNSSYLPTIVNGMDLPAVLSVIVPHATKRFESKLAGDLVEEMDTDQINAELARLPDKPDESLR